MESLDWSNILRDLLTWLANQVSTVMGGAVNVIGNVTSGIVNTVISVVFAIYCLSRKDILARQGRRVLYSVLNEKTADEIIRVVRLTNVTFSNFISGQCLEAVILGGLFGKAYAGGNGNEKHFIVALEMSPERLQIGDFKYNNSKTKKWPIKPKVQPKIAYVEDGKVVIASMTKESLSNLSHSLGDGINVSLEDRI